jgi:NitT/TauT family transport system ATP-binding protein
VESTAEQQHITSNGAATPVVEIERVNKVFRTRSGPVHALDDVSLSLGEGEFASIVGPSGCGKSTALRILGGLTRPTNGKVAINGTPVRGPRRDTAFVFQRPLLLDWMTVLNNVLIPAKIRGEVSAEKRARAHALLDLVGIGEFAERLPRELSGGMQQRAAMARALLNDPALLLLDEPFGSLDALTREQLHLELLRIWSVSEGEDPSKTERLGAKTILMVTHDIPEAVFLSDIVLIMSRRPGRVVGRVRIDLPRPRVLEATTTAEFGELVAEIRRILTEATLDTAAPQI